MARKAAAVTPPPPSESNRGHYPFKEWALNHTERYAIGEYDKIRTAIANLNRNKALRYRYSRVWEDNDRGKSTEYVRVWRVK